MRKILEKENSPKVYIPGELGIGLNPLSKLCGRMLEDEGALGTVHLGFGSNSTIGGENKVSFHIDMVMKDVTVFIDGKETKISTRKQSEEIAGIETIYQNSALCDDMTIIRNIFMGREITTFLGFMDHKKIGQPSTRSGSLDSANA